MINPRDSFDLYVDRIHELADEAMTLDASSIERLQRIRILAEVYRNDADRAVNEIYKAGDKNGGRACVSRLKRNVQIDLLMIRARHRWALDPDGERRRSYQRARELAYSDLASTDTMVRDSAKKTLSNLGRNGA